MSALTQRDRALVALVIRRLVARDIGARGLASTYEPAALSVFAFELVEFASELLNCHDGDNVELAQAAASEIDALLDGPDDQGAQYLLEDCEPCPELKRLDDTERVDVASWRRGSPTRSAESSSSAGRALGVGVVSVIIGKAYKCNDPRDRGRTGEVVEIEGDRARLRWSTGRRSWVKVSRLCEPAFSLVRLEEAGRRVFGGGQA